MTFSLPSAPRAIAFPITRFPLRSPKTPDEFSGLTERCHVASQGCTAWKLGDVWAFEIEPVENIIHLNLSRGFPLRDTTIPGVRIEALIEWTSFFLGTANASESGFALEIFKLIGDLLQQRQRIQRIVAHGLLFCVDSSVVSNTASRNFLRASCSFLSTKMAATRSGIKFRDNETGWMQLNAAFRTFSTHFIRALNSPIPVSVSGRVMVPCSLISRDFHG